MSSSISQLISENNSFPFPFSPQEHLNKQQQGTATSHEGKSGVLDFISLCWTLGHVPPRCCRISSVGTGSG